MRRNWPQRSLRESFRQTKSWCNDPVVETSGSACCGGREWDKDESRSCSLTGHGEEFWPNLVHWRNVWQSTSASLSWELHEQYEKAKIYDTERWTHWSVGDKYAAGEEWRNSFRRNEEAEPKWKQSPVVDVSGGKRKVQCCKEQYFIVPGSSPIGSRVIRSAGGVSNWFRER